MIISKVSNGILIESYAQFKACLCEEMKYHLDHMTSLSEIHQAINNCLDIGLILDLVVEKARVCLHIDAADILIFDQSESIFRYAHGQGFLANASPQPFLKISDDLAGKVAFERRLYIIPNLIKGGRGFKRARDFAREGFITYIGVPLVAKGVIKGVMEIFQRKAFKPAKEWLGFLEVIASEVVIALEHIQLFDSLQYSNNQAAIAYTAAIDGWVRALNIRDIETKDHTRRVTELTVCLAKRMGLTEPQINHVRQGALLHDIGKIGISDSILLKPGPLTRKEWEVMRKHPAIAHDLLAPLHYLKPALDIPYCHHEKWDGTGYPRGVIRDQIPQAARLFAIVDVWDALRFDRPYRKAWPEKKVREYLHNQSGKHFDPEIVDIFFHTLEAQQE